MYRANCQHIPFRLTRTEIDIKGFDGPGMFRQVIEFIEDHIKPGQDVGIYKLECWLTKSPTFDFEEVVFALRWCNMDYMPSVYDVMCRRLEREG
jgi:hypothetical protein